MKYYVRKNAASEIEGPFDLEAIRGWIAGGRFTIDSEAIEENGRSAEQVQLSRRWQRLEDLFAEPASLSAGRLPAAVLAEVRQNSCYKTLRVFIDLTAWAAWVAVALVTFYEVFKPSPGERTLRMLLGLGALGLGSLALVAARQSALLFADIADLLIEQNRRR